MRVLLCSVALFLTSAFVIANESTVQRIKIEQEGSGHYQAGQIEYSFQLLDSKNNTSLSDQDLIESHTKKLHFIAFDAALKEFNHVHSTFNGKSWKVILSLPVDGNYSFWAQGVLLDRTEFSSRTNAMIMGGEVENQIIPLGDVRTGADNKTQIALADTNIRSGKMAMLQFTISRTDGQTPVLTPYLGAFTHVIATTIEGDELTHVHPMQGSKPNTGMLHATFPQAGNYRLWVQLNDLGELKTIPLSVTVSK